MVKYFFLLLLFSFTVSCASVGLSSKVQRTSVGMTKQEVVRTLGKQYQTVHSMLTPKGDVMEVLRFSDIYGTEYEYEFQNDVLVRYTKLLQSPEPEHRPGHRH